MLRENDDVWRAKCQEQCGGGPDLDSIAKMPQLQEQGREGKGIWGLLDGEGEEQGAYIHTPTHGCA
jgi:hypothetical protein